MRTRRFKTLRGWLEFWSKRESRSRDEVYERATDFFAVSMHAYYWTDYGTENAKWHNERVVVPWEEKLPVARQIVDFHWSRRTKDERERIAVALAKGKGDLSYLQSFSLSILKVDGKWTYQYCTCGLSGPNYDYCRRKYLQSL